MVGDASNSFFTEVLLVGEESLAGISHGVLVDLDCFLKARAGDIAKTCESVYMENNGSLGLDGDLLSGACVLFVCVGVVVDDEGEAVGSSGFGLLDGLGSTMGVAPLFLYGPLTLGGVVRGSLGGGGSINFVCGRVCATGWVGGRGWTCCTFFVFETVGLNGSCWGSKDFCPC